jgi:hypothetical protein
LQSDQPLARKQAAQPIDKEWNQQSVAQMQARRPAGYDFALVAEGEKLKRRMVDVEHTATDYIV